MAVNTGKSSITFTSNISGISKTFEFIIKTIDPNSVVLNSINYNIGDLVNMNLKLNTLTNFSVSIFPCYAYGEIIYESSNNITIANNSILLKSPNNESVYINFNNKTILTCNINFISSFKVEISLGLHENNISLSGDNLLIKLCDQNIFVLICNVFNTTTNQIENVDLNIKILDTNIISGTTSTDYVEIKNGSLTLIALKNGTTKIIFSNNEYNINYELIIEISE